MLNQWLDTIIDGVRNEFPNATGATVVIQYPPRLKMMGDRPVKYKMLELIWVPTPGVGTQCLLLTRDVTWPNPPETPGDLGWEPHHTEFLVFFEGGPLPPPSFSTEIIEDSVVVHYQVFYPQLRVTHPHLNYSYDSAALLAQDAQQYYQARIALNQELS